MLAPKPLDSGHYLLNSVAYLLRAVTFLLLLGGIPGVVLLWTWAF